MITEVEAYDGPSDRASHAFKGLTPRTKALFGPAGYLYVYFIYGMYYMLNITTGDVGYPAGVLIRSTDKVSGPGRLAKALSLDRTHMGMKLGKENRIWIEDRGVNVSPREIERTPRINVAYAGPLWSGKLYRFVYKSKPAPMN